MAFSSILPFTSTGNNDNNNNNNNNNTTKCKSIKNLFLQLGTPRIALVLMSILSLLLLSISSFQHKFNYSIPSIQPISTANSSTPANTTITSPTSRIQIFDVILFNNELDWLEIRLNELGEYVDFFVIVESEITFSGRQRSLSYRDNQERFKAFSHQIIHMVIPSELLANKGDPWDVELWTRNYGFAGVIETHRPNEGDWLILSDVDEIPRRSTVAAMKDPSLSRYPGRLFGDGTAGSGGDLFRFGCQFYYYSYEYRHEGGLWNGPVIVRFRELDSPKLLKQRSEAQRVAMLTMVRGKWKEAGSLLRDYRNGDQATYVDDSCIHCSWCFSNITQVINKMESYSHGEHNQEKYKVQDWIIEKYRNGEDLFERDADKFDYVENNLDLPHYVQEHKDRFMYMLSRRGMDGGFVDVTIKSE